MHPRDREGKKFPICGSYTGCMGCCKKYENSELNVLGLGMTNYFKIIKTLTLVFLIICFFNIFLFVVYTNSNKREKVSNYQDALFKTTIGNIASGKINKKFKEKIFSNKFISLKNLPLNFSESFFCQKFDYKKYTTVANIELNCRDTIILNAENFGGSRDTKISAVNKQSCNGFSSRNNVKNDDCQIKLKQIFQQQINEKCKSKRKCNIQIKLDDLVRYCPPYLSMDIYMTYSCYGKNFSNFFYFI